jgi:hypothetical protein
VITDAKALNKQQSQLRKALEGALPHEEAIQLCLNQHAMLHSARVTQSGIWSYEDEILDNLSEELFRRVPPGEEHSIVWNIWHLARIEDTAMNFLVAGGPSVFDQGDWLVKLKAPFRDTGNEMLPQEIKQLSVEIDLENLRAYRAAVGSRTQAIIAGLSASDLKQRVDPVRIQSVLDIGAVRPEASYITDYWSKRNIAGLLLMPATRHNIVHLNEAARLKKKR